MKIDNVKRINASGVHSVTQKSKTLYRRAIQKPASLRAPIMQKVGRSMDIARSKSISHFAARPIAKDQKTVATTKQQPDIQPSRHPLAARVDNLRAAAKNRNELTKANLVKASKIIKEEAIEQAFKKLADHHDAEHKVFKHRSKLLNKFLLIVSIIFLIAIGYFIYINVPILSVRVASAQSGINATYPEYCPDGYSLDGSVSYSDGQVTMSFKSKTDNTKFTIKQVRSSWDSSAVKNQVDKDSNGAVVNTTTERGLTIYNYNNNATWVNGGILYTISGDAHLSVDQTRRIATSL